MNRPEKKIRLWMYRDYIIGSVYREIQLKYKNSLFGVGWLIINPLTMIGVYTLIFSHVMRSKIPGVENAEAYSVFLLAGIIHWGLLLEIWSKGPEMFRSNANILKKVYVPTLCIPLVVLFGSLINYLIVLCVMLVFIAPFGLYPGVHIVGLIIPLAILVLLAISCAVIFGVFNVYFRDVGQISSVIAQLIFWVTPIVYSVEILPEKVRPFFDMNPLSPIFRAFQTVFVNRSWPDFESMIYPAIVTLAFLILAFKTLRSHAAEMMDEF